MKRILLAALITVSSLFTGCQASDVSAAAGSNTEHETAAAVEPAIASDTAKGTIPTSDTALTAEAVTQTEPEAATKSYPPGTELTIAAYDEESYLEYVAQEFMKRRENVTVTINLYSNSEVITEKAGGATLTTRTNGAEDMEKYRQTLNTSMMSGSGEDIVDAFTLNWRRLADRDMLVDLNEGLKLDNENYYMNILDGYLYKDKRVTLPLNFIFEGFKFSEESPAANETAAELTLENMQAIADKYPGIALFSGGGSGMGAERLAEEHFFRNIDAFMNAGEKTVNLNDGQFEEILTKIKTILDTVKPDEERKTRLDIYESGEPYLMEQYLIYTPAMASAGLVDYEGVFPLTYNGLSTYQTNGYMPAVNANTKNKELAFDFIQFMISEEMMLSPEQLFCTVNRNAVREKTLLSYESIAAEGFAPEGFTEENLIKNISLFDEMAAKVSVPEYRDGKISEFLRADLSEFFQGNAGAEETCESLQSKINMYINE